MGILLYTSAAVTLSFWNNILDFYILYTGITLLLMLIITGFICFMRSKFIKMTLYQQFQSIIRSIYGQFFVLIGVYSVMVIFNCSKIGFAIFSYDVPSIVVNLVDLIIQTCLLQIPVLCVQNVQRSHMAKKELPKDTQK